MTLCPAVHTMLEMKMTGNSLRGSRPMLAFDKVKGARTDTHTHTHTHTQRHTHTPQTLYTPFSHTHAHTKSGWTRAGIRQCERGTHLHAPQIDASEDQFVSKSVLGATVCWKIDVMFVVAEFRL